jgi:hypothetical protein
MEAGSFPLQTIALARIGSDCSDSSPFSCSPSPLSLVLGRSVGTGCCGFLLTATLLSLLI